MVVVQNAARAPIPRGRVRAVLAGAGQVAEIGARLPEGGWGLAVRISGDGELRRLNRQFLGEDRPTDVLSFPSGDRGPGAHLGDIVISWPAVVRQAAHYGHPEDTELALLAVHGFLHVLGWDHAGTDEEAEMVRLTVAALRPSDIHIAPGRL